MVSELPLVAIFTVNGEKSHSIAGRRDDVERMEEMHAPPMRSTTLKRNCGKVGVG